MVIAICVFVLLLTFVLPHTGGARGWDVLVGNDAAIRDGVALPSRVFAWLVLVFSVGFSMLALTTRRWALDHQLGQGGVGAHRRAARRRGTAPPSGGRAAEEGPAGRSRRRRYRRRAGWTCRAIAHLIESSLLRSAGSARICVRYESRVQRFTRSYIECCKQRHSRSKKVNPVGCSCTERIR